MLYDHITSEAFLKTLRAALWRLSLAVWSQKMKSCGFVDNMHILYWEKSYCNFKREGKFEQSRAESWKSADAHILSGFPLLTGCWLECINKAGNDNHILELHNHRSLIMNHIIIQPSDKLKNCNTFAVIHFVFRFLLWYLVFSWTSLACQCLAWRCTDNTMPWCCHSCGCWTIWPPGETYLRYKKHPQWSVCTS